MSRQRLTIVTAGPWIRVISIFFQLENFLAVTKKMFSTVKKYWDKFLQRTLSRVHLILFHFGRSNLYLHITLSLMDQSTVVSRVSRHQ